MTSDVDWVPYQLPGSLGRRRQAFPVPVWPRLRGPRSHALRYVRRRSPPARLSTASASRSSHRHECRLGLKDPCSWLDGLQLRFSHALRQRTHQPTRLDLHFFLDPAILYEKGCRHDRCAELLQIARRARNVFDAPAIVYATVVAARRVTTILARRFISSSWGSLFETPLTSAAYMGSTPSQRRGDAT